MTGKETSRTDVLLYIQREEAAELEELPVFVFNLVIWGKDRRTGSKAKEWEGAVRLEEHQKQEKQVRGRRKSRKQQQKLDPVEYGGEPCYPEFCHLCIHLSQYI